MSDYQLRIILYAALSYLLGNVVAWGAFGTYLWFTGRM